MSNITFGELEKGDAVFFARILPNNDYYKVMELSIVSVRDTYCTGTDLKTKQTFLFEKRLAEEVLFDDKSSASKYLNYRKRKRE